MASWKQRTAAIAALTSLAVLSSCSDTVTEEGKKETPKTNYITTPVITDASIKAGDTVSLVDTIEYTLSGLVFVEEGAVLTIPAGTVLKGEPGQAENASALVIARGGKIYAEGTAAKPIIFTAKNDDVKDNGDMAADADQLWGGVILLGKAPVSRPNGVGQIEGIVETNPNGAYGGTDAADNSGILRYVSIRHGGTKITTDSEINGLTLAGVGSGTVIDNIEVYNNSDDGVEFFGGTVNTTNIIVVGARDDSYDWDEGYRGTNKNWIAIQKDYEADKLAEMDGRHKDNFGITATPFSKPSIENATFIGKTGGASLKFREETGGIYKNSIFVNLKNAEIDDEAGSELISTNHAVKGDWKLEGNIFEHADASKLMKYTAKVTNGTDITALVQAGNTFGATSGVTASNLTPLATYATKGAVAASDWTSWTFWAKNGKK